MIVILKGGPSPEAEISRKSAESIKNALEQLGYKVVDIEFDKDCVKNLLEIKPKKVFIALHGVPGEDGSVQGLLEALNIPYTGCGVETSAICIDKDVTKKVLKSFGIPVPTSETFYNRKNISWIESPCIVKPARTGSTVGISLVKNREEFQKAVELAFKFDSKIIIEEFIEGRELTIPVLNGKPLPIIEIITESGFYDFNSKYKKSTTKYITPAEISEKTKRKIEQIAIKTYSILECKGAVRMDFRLNQLNIPYLLEVNTIPGMTERSLLPKSAAAAGMKFHQLIEEMLTE